MCDQWRGGEGGDESNPASLKKKPKTLKTPKKPFSAFPPNAKKNAKKTLRTPSMSRGISCGSTHGVLVTHQKVHCQGRALYVTLLFCIFFLLFA